ncbi:carbohydrate ABC transporter permease [Auraticoccus monumenti]|uniref:Carbohydrate ABC transporter membrane protein 2, CUT1 family n=1 Tax=Auraticoccus monumenti TaxID=675864 RepID=A0A1G7D1J0_9ACTN|nr:carbohydrate ABC transporter permease [Auraticoccus monumenti]SDE45353.1 carbohydrate ABC transporter membrane protein 2, CUT1 family [Auraticoccus monumenti]
MTTSTLVAPAPAHRPTSRRTRRATWATRLGLVAVTLLVLVPFAWMVSISFTPEQQAFSSAALVPSDPTLTNYVDAFTDANLGRAMANSFVVTVVPVLTNCLAAVAAGYAFALLPFRGSTALFYLLLSTAAIPGSVTLIPLFLMAKGFPLAGGNDLGGYGGTGLLDSLPGLMLPHLVMTMNIFLARQYFSTANRDLAEAARVDGAGEWRIFTAIYLPLSRPIVAVIAIFTFTGVWDDFLWPLVITQSPQVQTVQLALAQFLATGTVRYGTMMAGAVLATLPVLIVFLLNQRHFVSGLTEGSVKG